MFEADNHLNTKELREGLNAIIELKSNSDEMIQDLQLYSQNMMEIQQQNACEIISSQDRIAERVDKSNRLLTQIGYGMYDLKASFDWNMAKVSWQLEQSNNALKKLVDNCYKVIENRAIEYRKRGENAYKNRWVEDSLKEFLIAEKLNVYDFTIHMYLGIIYYEEMNNQSMALEYFEKSAHYAKPVSNLYHSQALIYQAKIFLDQKELYRACSLAKQAYEIKSDFTEAMYMYAKCSAFTNDTATAIDMLEKAIRIDVDYCDKCYNDKDFFSIIKDIESLFRRLLNEQSDMISKSFPAKKEKATELFKIISMDIPEIAESNLKLRQKCYSLESHIYRINTLIKRNSYRDLLEANDKIEQLPSPISDICIDVISALKGKIESLENDIRTIELSNKNLQSKWMEKKQAWYKKLNERLDDIEVGWKVFGWIGGFLLGLTTCTINFVNTDGVGDEVSNNFGIWIITWAICGVIAFWGYFIHKKFIKRVYPYSDEPTNRDSSHEDNLLKKYSNAIAQITILHNSK